MWVRWRSEQILWFKCKRYFQQKVIFKTFFQNFERKKCYLINKKKEVMHFFISILFINLFFLLFHYKGQYERTESVELYLAFIRSVLARSRRRRRADTAELTWGRPAAFYRRRCSVGWLPGAAAGSAGTAGGRGPEWGSLGITGPQRLRALGARWYFSWKASCTRRASPRCPPCTPP